VRGNDVRQRRSWHLGVLCELRPTGNFDKREAPIRVTLPNEGDLNGNQSFRDELSEKEAMDHAVSEAHAARRRKRAPRRS